MARYLCQFCNRILTNGENHPCLFYKNDDSVYSLPLPEGSDQEDKKHDDGKDKFTEITKDISRNTCPAFTQRGKETSEVSFMPASSKTETRRTFTENISKIGLIRNSYEASFSNPTFNNQVNEYLSKENACLKTSSRNSPSSCIFESAFPEFNERNYVHTDYIIEQKSGPKVSHAILESSNKKCHMSLEKSKWKSLHNDKDIFMDLLDRAKKETHSGKKNISGISNLIARSDFPLLNEAPDNPMIELLESNSKRNEISTNVSESIDSKKNDNADKPGSSGTCSSKNDFSSNLSPDHFNQKSNFDNENEEMDVEEKEPVYSMKSKKSVTGPSGIHLHKKKFGGDISSEILSCKRKLNSRYNTYSGDKPFVCGICKKQYSLKGNLKRHFRIHTGEKPFVCDQCGKKFTQKVHFDYHYRSHSNDYPLVCDVCKMGFSVNSELIRHIRTHTGEKPFKCPVCEKAFARKSNCNRHHRTMHT